MESMGIRRIAQTGEVKMLLDFKFSTVNYTLDVFGNSNGSISR